MTAPETAARRLVVLTPTQRKVLGQLTHDGAENSTIAARLGISEHTVKTHMKSVLKAFGCTNRAAVAVDCLRGRVQVRVVKNVRGPAPREEPA